MYDVASQDEPALRAQLERARERLAALVRDLRGLDGELEALAGERPRYRLLEQLCGGLEELDELGAAGLFWGEGAASGESQEHLRRVRAPGSPDRNRHYDRV